MRLGIFSAAFAAAFMLSCWPRLAEAQALPAPPPLEVYGALPSVEHMTLSPSGQRLAFIGMDGDDRKLFVRKVGGNALLAIKVGDSKVRDMRFVGDDFVTLSISATVKPEYMAYWPVKEDRFESFVVMCINLKTGQSFLVFNKEPKGRALFYKGVIAQYGYRQSGGRWYGYFSAITADMDHDVDLYRTDLETGESELVARGGRGEHDWVVAPDGKVLVSLEYNGETKDMRLLAGDGGREFYRRHDPFGGVGVGGPGRAPGTVIVEESTADRERVEEYDLTAPDKPTVLVDDQAVETILLDPVTNLAIGARTDRDEGVILFDPKLQGRFNALRKAFPGLRVKPVSFTPGFDKVIAFTDGGDDAGTYWLVDLTTGQASELTEAYPAVRPNQVGSTRMVAYKAADGQALEGVLTLPPGPPKGKLPLVVMPHGGPLGLRDRVGFDWWAQAFASRGYAVFQPNYRGSDGYGAAFRNAAVGEWGRKMLTDMSDGVAALADQGVIDPNRVCIVGASYGGYAALAGVTIQHGLYRCAVAVGAVSNPGGALARIGDKGGASGWNVEIRYLRRLMGAAFAGDPELRAVSPIFHAGEADQQAPVLLIHGEDDTVVQIRQSVEMHARLTAAGKDAELIRLKGEDHWLSSSSTRTAMLKAAVEFVQKHNPAG